MRTSTLFRNSLCAAGLALLGLSGCGPDYAIFKVHVTSAAPRDDIKECRMTITDNGKKILDEFPLEKEYGTDSAGQPILRQGCEGSMTRADVGYFSYSTSRKSGSLTFTVTGWGGPDNLTVIEQGTSEAKEVKAYPPEITVDIAMTRKAP